MRYFALAFVFLSLLTRIAHAQSQTFSWSISLGFGQCELVPGKLAPLTKTSSFDGVSPFYMISYELGGIATTDFIGTEWQNLTWPVRHPQGAQVFLNVVDSFGNSGGILSGIVQGGATSDCLHPKPTSPMKVVTDLPQVETCDSVNATITGGRKPYTVSIVSTTNYRSPSNFTIGEDDDVFTYVNRVAPGDSFIVTASDSLGQWAYGTNFISSVGSNDTSCPGKQSFGSQSTNSSQSSNIPSASIQNNRISTRLSTAAIVGIAAGGATFVVSVVLAVFFFMRRRRRDFSATNRSIFPPSGPGDITPFISPPGSELQSGPQMGQFGTHTSIQRGSATDYSSVPLLRTPQPPSRHRASHSHLSQPIIPTSTTGQPEPDSVYGHYLDPFAPMIDFDSRRTSSNTVQSGEDTVWLRLQSPTLDARPVSVLLFSEGSTCASSTRTAKQRLSNQAARERDREIRTTVLQHRDSQYLHLNTDMNLIEVPPAYRERTGVGPSGRF